MLLFAIITSTLTGALIVITRIFNFKMADKMGLFEGASINYIGGLLGSMLLALLLVRPSKLDFGGIPLWAYLGGLFGIAIVVLSSYLTKRVSSFYLTLLIFLGQLITGILLDWLVEGYLSIPKIIGGALVLIGFIYNLYVDHIEEENERKQAA